MASAGVKHLAQFQEELKPVLRRLLESNRPFHPTPWFESAWAVVSASMEYGFHLASTLPRRVSPLPFAKRTKERGKVGNWSDSWEFQCTDMEEVDRLRKEDSQLRMIQRFWQDARGRYREAANAMQRAAFLRWYMAQESASYE